MTKNKHNKDKRLHNSEEKLHNSPLSHSERPDLTWQETTDLLPQDEAEGGTEIYYFTDEDGNVHSREFLPQELIPDDDNDLDGSLQRESSTVNAQRLNSGTTDVVNLVHGHEEPATDVSIPLPRSKAGPIDVRISSEVVPDLSMPVRVNALPTVGVRVVELIVKVVGLFTVTGKTRVIKSEERAFLSVTKVGSTMYE